MIRKDRYILLLMVLILIGGLLASAQAKVNPTWAYGKKTDEELLRIATHELVHELREAAASVLTTRLLKRVIEEGQVPELNYLEDLGRSPTPELRSKVSVSGLLIFGYMEALSRGELSPAQLIQGIRTGETPELREARAASVFLALFSQEALGLSLTELFERLLTAPEGIEIEEMSLAPELALDLLRRLEDLMRGREGELWGYRFDGSLEAIRRAAFWLGFFLSFMETGPAALQLLHPCEGWLELAGEGETKELRWFASFVYFNVSHCAPREPELLRELAIRGVSSELRYFAAISYFEIVKERLGLAELIELATHGESEELREAVKHWLVWSFVEALFEGTMSAEELYNLGFEGKTPQLRWAAGRALGFYWQAHLPLLRISDIPRRSPAEAHTLEQALIIFATENTIAHPELAQAAVPPLRFIWGERGISLGLDLDRVFVRSDQDEIRS